MPFIELKASSASSITSLNALKGKKLFRASSAANMKLEYDRVNAKLAVPVLLCMD
jgi:hypothetical protein